MPYFLGYPDEPEVSEEFYYLADIGIVVVNVYDSMKGTIIVASSRNDFEWTCQMVQWYATVRKIGLVVHVNMDRWEDRGQLSFLVAG